MLAPVPLQGIVGCDAVGCRGEPQLTAVKKPQKQQTPNMLDKKSTAGAAWMGRFPVVVILNASDRCPKKPRSLIGRQAGHSAAPFA